MGKPESRHFELMILEKVQAMLKEKGIPRTMKTEEQQKSEFKELPNEQKQKLLTPDILFDSGVRINGQLIHWIEIKNFFLLSGDKFMLRKVKRAIKKYTQRFGKGALVCRGWQSDLKKKLDC